MLSEWTRIVAVEIKPSLSSCMSMHKSCASSVLSDQQSCYSTCIKWKFSFPVVQLEVEHLSLVHDELYDARSKWYDLGMKLDVKVTELDRSRQQFSNSSVCLREIPQHWLQSSPCPTWEGVCAALRSCTVGEHPLAQQLEGTYGQVAEDGAEDGGED